MHSLSLVAAVIAAIAYCSNAYTNPGILLEVEQNGLDFVKNLTLSLLAKEFKGRYLPDINGATSVNPSDPLAPDLRYFLSKVKVTYFDADPENTKIWTIPGKGIEMMVSKLCLTLKATYHFQLGWFPIGKDGEIEAKAADISMKVMVDTYADKGRLQIRDESFEFKVGSLALVFSGDLIDTILNMVQGQFDADIRRSIENATMSSAQWIIDGPIDQYLAKMPVELKLMDGFTIDYGLVDKPIVGRKSLQLPIKGEIFRNDQHSTSAVPPELNPLQEDKNTMLSVQLTDYTFITAASTAYNTGFLSLNLTRDQVEASAPGYGQYLNTSCDTICVGTLIGPIGKAYPDQAVDIDLWASSEPVPFIDNSGFHLFVTAMMTLSIPTNTTKKVKLVDVYVETQANLKKVYLNTTDPAKPALHLQIHMTNSTLKLITASLPKITEKSLQSLWNFALSLGVESMVNAKGQAGFKLPTLPYVQLVNTSITTIPRAVIFKTGIKAA